MGSEFSMSCNASAPPLLVNTSYSVPMDRVRMFRMKASSSTHSTRGRHSGAVVIGVGLCSRGQKTGGAGSFAPCVDPIKGPRRGHRPRDEITLAHIATQMRQEVPVLLILDAFGNHFHLQLMRHTQARVANRTPRRICRCAMHEAPVHLEFVERQVAQLRQGRVPGAEVVDRQPEALE